MPWPEFSTPKMVSLPTVLNFADAIQPHSVTESASPVAGRKREVPRNAEVVTWLCNPSKRNRVTRSGIGNSAFPGMLDGSVIDDLLSSTAADQVTFDASFCAQRACACRMDANPIGDSKSMVRGMLSSSTNVDQVWPASSPPQLPYA